MAVIIEKSEKGSAERVGELLSAGKVGVIPCDTIYPSLDF